MIRIYTSAIVALVPHDLARPEVPATEENDCKTVSGDAFAAHVN
jgi:hypothetical protein